ncbi:Flp family type IVb pilin [Roseovarius mucosus]|uniref:Flp family type IVb pilin n=1 Tax=Roseovarius mucosus TaxID=215743 RepID=UPI003BA89A22
MIKFFKNFSKDEDGAVTVDWVVLTAAVVGLGIAGVSTVNTGIGNLATTIEGDLSGATMTGLGTLGQ